MLFKRKKTDKVKAQYTAIIDAARNPMLYTDYNVPDDPAGRFQMITLHASPILMAYQADNDGASIQALFDMIFADIELSFREIGVGDLGVPKKMKAYMKDFNGVLQAHAQPNADHIGITQRNVFGETDTVNAGFAKYIKGVFDAK
jgi:cytochrome b pre-mRNA-processing protein 3